MLRLTKATKMAELTVDEGVMGGQGNEQKGEGVGCEDSDQIDEKVLQL
jgi:hypothetical protein